MNNSKTAIITGATSGIGTVVAEHLAKMGYNTVILGRSPEKMNSLINSLKEINSEITVKGIPCDLSSLESTKKACSEVKKECASIDLLILNAGLWNTAFRESASGIEETLHVNLISQIQVFQELRSTLPANGEGKVIITASSLHRGEIQFEDLEFKEEFSGFKAYQQSKLGVLLSTRWLAKQPENQGISIYCVHPGVIRTNLDRSAGWSGKLFFKLFGKSVEKGALTHIHLIDSDTSSLRNGEYYANKKVTKTTAYSYDMAIAERLQIDVNKYLKSNF